MPIDARRVLDLGCSTGALGEGVKQRTGAHVLGVELSAAYAARARTRLDRVVISDVERFLSGPTPLEAPFDCLIAADVLEHLIDPWGAMRRAVDLLEPGATVVVSVPNVAHWRGLVRLVWTGRWPRDDEGPFDRTHLRWFTRQDGLELLLQAGIQPMRVEPRYWSTGLRLRLDRLMARTPLDALLPVQFVISGTKPTSG